MKSKAIVCAVAAASLGFASLSFAQDYERRGSRGEPSHAEQHRSFGGPGYAPGYAPGYVRIDGRGDARGGGRMYGPGPRSFHHRDVRNDRHFDRHGRQLHRGGHIPNEYRGRQYVVNDWRGRHLHAPQRGQQWVQVGTDYALIAIATGVIAQLVLN
ncbi:RcnB family protein [Polaromonas aquatica]|uniref:RcnB family protein n=1 Tax=Polaromonas aquatica TaxID=332657 RepID=UPI003D660EE3